MPQSSLDVWLKSSRKVTVGGRELFMMPLPLTKLYAIGRWLELNANDVVKETITATEPGEIPNPMVLVARVLLKVDVNEIALQIFSLPKNPDNGEQVNKGLTKEFFDDYFDMPTAQLVFKEFVELNDIGNLIKNLQSLPVVKKLMEASSLTFGIPFLNSLRLSTDSNPNKLEGSPSPKSTDLSPQTTEGSSEKNQTENPPSRVM